jgi:hypothetical protein
MRDSNVANAAKESAQDEFPHGLHEIGPRGLLVENGEFENWRVRDEDLHSIGAKRDDAGRAQSRAHQCVWPLFSCDRLAACHLDILDSGCKRTDRHPQPRIGILVGSWTGADAAAHVYRQYVADFEQFGSLRCQIANTVVSDLRRHLIACGNLGVRPGEPEPDPDIVTFRLPAGADRRLGKAAISAPPDTWPPPNPGEQVMFGGFPGQERIISGPGAISFGFHSGMFGGDFSH